MSNKRQRTQTRRDWVALGWSWYRDDVLEVIADELPLVIALWPVLVAQAHEQSDNDRNPTGVIGTTVKKLAASSRVPATIVQKILEKLVEGEMIEIKTGRLGILKIRLVNYREWNHPRRSPAREKQEERHADKLAGKKESTVGSLSGVVGSESETVGTLSAHDTTLHNTKPPHAMSLEGSLTHARKNLGAALQPLDALIEDVEQRTNIISKTKRWEDWYKPALALVNDVGQLPVASACKTAMERGARKFRLVELICQDAKPAPPVLPNVDADTLAKIAAIREGAA